MTKQTEEKFQTYADKRGGPAFPFTFISKFDARTGAPTDTQIFPGMTLRDYFAGQALAGAMAVMSVASEESLKSIARENGLALPTTRSAVAASVAYGYADAMLAERSK